MDNPNNRRIFVAVIVAIAVMFGVLSLATLSSYNQGLVDGMARGTQIVVPNSAPAAPAPYVYQQPYYSQPAGGFSLIGLCFNVLVFVAVLFVISRILRCAFGRRRWGGNVPWSHGKGDWRDWHNGPYNNGPRQNPNDFRNTPNKSDEQVI